MCENLVQDWLRLSRVIVVTYKREKKKNKAVRPSDVSKEAFRQEGFEVVPPIEYNSMKTVVVKQLDYMIDSFNDEEIIDSIENLNKWAKVESIYKIPSTSKILKIRFKTQQMAQLALDNGVKILHQYISKWNVEKEVFVRLNPCRNCFQYDHKLKDCILEKKSRCTFCAGEHRQHECKAKQALCINCGGPHRTLAATCKIRKDLIKKRSGEMRDQIRTQTRQQQFTSYADATSATKGSKAGSSVGGGALGLTKDETKQMVTTIMSAIVYSHYSMWRLFNLGHSKKACVTCINAMALSQLIFQRHLWQTWWHKPARKFS